MNTRTLGAFLSFAAAIILSSGIGVAQQPKLGIDEIAQSADLIFIGAVQRQETRWNDSRRMILTDIYFGDIVQVAANARAVQANKDVVRLTYAGGAIGDTSIFMSDMPSFAMNHRYLVFMYDDGMVYTSPLIGGPQGMFEVVEDAGSHQQYLLTPGDKIVTSIDSKGITMSRKPVMSVRDGNIRYVEAAQAAGRFMEYPQSSSGEFTFKQTDLDNHASAGPLPAENFLNYIRSTALASTLKERVLSRGGRGVFYYKNGDAIEKRDFQSGRLTPIGGHNGLTSSHANQLRVPPAAADGARGRVVNGPYSTPSINGGALGACGYQDIHIDMEEVPQSNWSYQTNMDCLGVWNNSMDLFRYTDYNGPWGNNSTNEFDGFINDNQLYSAYGVHWGTNLAITHIDHGFLQPQCGEIVQSDIAYNDAYTWTDDAEYALAHPPVVLLRPNTMHELGHAWGYQLGKYVETYDYDSPTVMMPYYFGVVEDGWGVHAVDAEIVRLHYSDQEGVPAYTDVGVESYYASNGLNNSTINGTAFYPGQSITFSGVTVENIGHNAVSNVRIRFYLSLDRNITASDYQLPVWWYWSSFGAESYSVGDYTETIPEGVPPGNYFVGAIVTINGFNDDYFTLNNSTSLWHMITVNPELQITGHVFGSDNEPISDVTMTGMPHECVTDIYGNYTAFIPYGWSGTVRPSKLGYYFDPDGKTYTNVTMDMSMNYWAGQLARTIIGDITEIRDGNKVGVPGVVLNGLLGNPVTNNDGYYIAGIPDGWSGTVTPTKKGFNFDPPSVAYDEVRSNRSQSYDAYRNFYGLNFSTYWLGGYAMGGVTLQGLPGNPVTDEYGHYSIMAMFEWSGTITPVKPGITFHPASVTITGLDTNRSIGFLGLNTFYTLNGCVRRGDGTGVPGVTIDAGAWNTVTDDTGAYAISVIYGWSGTATPSKAGNSFSPSFYTYSPLAGDQRVDYRCDTIQCLIVGNIITPQGTPVRGVSMTGLPVVTTTGQWGEYASYVFFNWSGTVTPVKPGYAFDPPYRDYVDVRSTQLAHYFGKVDMTARYPKRWNLVSLPMVCPGGLKDTLFPTATSAAYCYELNAYCPKETLANGTGYWVKFPSTPDTHYVCLRGEPNPDDTIPITAGWNLIGGISMPFPVVSIRGDSPDLVTSGVFGYNGKYHEVDTMWPGQGYWIKASAAGMLYLLTDAPVPPKNRLTISRSFEIPPPPPEDYSEPDKLPADYALAQAYPNPFNPTTTIHYELPVESYVSLKVYDVLGQAVLTILNQAAKPAGAYDERVNASALTSGFYFYRLDAASVTGPTQHFTQTRKIVLLK